MERSSSFLCTSSTLSSSTCTFFFTTSSFSFQLFSTPSTARCSSSSAALPFRCSSSKLSRVLWNDAAWVCKVDKVRSRERIWGICGSIGDNRVRTGVSCSCSVEVAIWFAAEEDVLAGGGAFGVWCGPVPWRRWEALWCWALAFDTRSRSERRILRRLDIESMWRGCVRSVSWVFSRVKSGRMGGGNGESYWR